MLRDPVEETYRFKAVSAEVENKVMMTYIEPMVEALEDIIKNGFTYSKESKAFGEVNQAYRLENSGGNESDGNL